MPSYPKTPASSQPEPVIMIMNQIEPGIDQELATANTQPQMPIGTPQPSHGRKSSRMTCLKTETPAYNLQPEGLINQMNQGIDQIDQRIDQELATTANTQPRMPIGIPPQPPLGRKSSRMTCPYCSEEIWTRVETHPGLMNWLCLSCLCIPLTIFGYISIRTKIYIIQSSNYKIILFF